MLQEIGLHNRGVSSTRQRPDYHSSGQIEVQAVRIDTFVQEIGYYPKSIALWIDVEGAAYEVLDGIEKIVERVCLVHVEVETKAVWPGQKLEPDIVELMKRMNFSAIARGEDNIQHDLIFVKTDATEKFSLGINVILAFLLLKDKIRSIRLRLRALKRKVFSS